MISKTLLKENIIKEIIGLIARRVYQDGQRLPAERTLSERFNVSRGTLREALAKMAKLNILEIKPGSGIYVKKFSMRQIPSELIRKDFSRVSLHDITLARIAIELPGVELACQNHSKQDIQKLERFITKMSKQTENLTEYMKYDMEFHRSIIQAGKNRVLLVAFEAIHEFHIYSQIFVMEGASAHHTKILDAIKNKNIKLAKKYMKEHLEDLEGYIEFKK